MHNLTVLLSGLWNKIKRGTATPTLHISEDDIVVFVVGPTGSGKSWFAREATKSDLVKASKDYHPFTGEPQAIRCELTDEAKKDLQEGVRNVVLVDTPSFLTGCDYPDPRKGFEQWLKKTVYQPRNEYVGVIYTHRAETDPALEPIHDHLREFSAVIRGHVPRKRIHIVLTYDKTSSTVSSLKINERRTKIGSSEQLEQLNKSGWKTSVHKDLFEGDSEVAWSAIAELFRN